jgi:hypothetical protein
MARLSAIKIDSIKDVEGIWTDYSLGIKLKIARLGNPAYREYMRKIGKPHQVQISQNVLDDTTIEELSREAIAHTVLVGWENIDDDDDKPIKYSAETATAMLKDPECGELFNFVVAFADRSENFRKVYLENSKENLLRVSDGSKNGDI